MIDYIFRFAASELWDEQLAANTEMFFEADRLDTVAYQMIQSSSDSPEDWARFTEAKKIADAKRTAAYQDWMRIKRGMMKS